MQNPKTNADYRLYEKILISLGTFLMFAIIGIFIWACFMPISLWPPSELVKDLWPPLLFVAVPITILSYKYPKVFSNILCFFPGIGLD